jgi:hypothetical protein
MTERTRRPTRLSSRLVGFVAQHVAMHFMTPSLAEISRTMPILQQKADVDV